MIKSEKFIVGSEKNIVYQSLYEMISQETIFDKYLHLRLSGTFADVCNDMFFLTHEDGKGLSRIWMCYGKHEKSVSNWGAVFTPEEFRGKGYCAKTLEYCFQEIDSLKNPPLALFCTGGTLELATLYRKYGFVPALKGTDRGPLYRPNGNSPKTFQEFCNEYYTETDELFIVDADFGWRNEIDCLLRFALWDLGENFGIKDVNDLWVLLMEDPKRAKIVLTKENRCVGWMVDDIMQLYPKYRNVKKITNQ